MARKTKEESQRTKDAILDAAEIVFLDKGVGKATMADIADLAGVSRGAIYGHYLNKMDVCKAMCTRALKSSNCFTLLGNVSALEQLRERLDGFLKHFPSPAPSREFWKYFIRNVKTVKRTATFSTSRINGGRRSVYGLMNFSISLSVRGNYRKGWI